MIHSTTPYLDLPPVRQAQAVVSLPGSKSISNRILLLSALSRGQTQITGLLNSDDTRVMIDALRKLGVFITSSSPNCITVEGTSGQFKVKNAELFLGNAGTAFRPLTAVLALTQGHYSLSGVPRMHERPIKDLVDALCFLGAKIDYVGNPGFPPLSISPGQFQHLDFLPINGAISSQFLTALLLAAPLYTASTGQALTLKVQETLISKPYIDITLNLMARFGVSVQRDSDTCFTIPADAVYCSPLNIAVEGDASSASYFLGLGAIGGGPVRVLGVDEHSIQGDIAFTDILKSMGTHIQFGPQWVESKGVQVAKGEKLKAFDLDFNHIPDAAMTAAVLALYADGPCFLRNVGSWRVKETDRLQAMQLELQKLGAKVECGQDWLKVTPLDRKDWRSATIKTWDDHRIAMCFSLAAFGPVGIRLLEPGCVSKTFPRYFDHYANLVSA